MPHGEAARALEYMKSRGLDHFFKRGMILDIGCGPGPVVPGAVGVNKVGCPGVHEADASPSSPDLARLFTGTKFDVVFSSHVVEHIEAPILKTLRHWLSFVRDGGHMILYLPDERYYSFNGTTDRNPEHHHYLTYDTFQWFLFQLKDVKIHYLAYDVDPRHGRYSFLAILQKG